MFNRLNKFQAALALALYSQRALGESYGNSTSSDVLSTITSSASSASATASNSLSSSDGTVYLPSTTISGDLTVTGKVIATEAVEIATGGKLTLLDGEKYVFSSDLKVHGDLIVGKSEASYEGTSFDVSGETFEVSGNFSAEESAAVSASIYSFTPGSFESSGDISLSLSKAKKGEVTFSPYANSGAFSLSNAILNGGSVSGLERRAEDEGSENNGEINLDNGSTYVIVEPVSGNGTVNIISGNLYLHYPDTFTGQTVVFKGEGVLAVDPTETNATPIPVVGYTGKNQIAITADITALSYDGTTGVLTATQGNRQFSFAIGTGFSTSGFSVSEGTFAGLYTYYLNYDGVVATSAASSSTSTATSTTTSAATSADTSAATSTIFGASTSAAVSGSGSLSSSASSSGVSNSTTVSGSVGSSTLASASITSSAAADTAFTSGTASVYTTTLTYANATSTVVVSCSKATDARGNIYTITKTVPCSSTTATITSCDENGCHVPAPTATDATETVSSKSYTTVTVTHCDDNGCKVKTVTTEAPKQTTATTATVSEKTYTTITVTQCDDNGCNAKTITSEALKPTSLSTEFSAVSKSAAPTSQAITSRISTGIIVQSEGIAAGLKTNALSALVGIFVLALF